MQKSFMIELEDALKTLNACGGTSRIVGQKFSASKIDIESQCSTGLFTFCLLLINRLSKYNQRG